MLVNTFVLALLPLSYVSCSPLVRRQEESSTPTVIEGSPSEPPSEPPSESSISPPVVSPPSEDPSTSPVRGTPEPGTPIPSPPGSSPSPVPTDPEDDCPPCEDEPLFTSQSPSGKVCYCLGGGERGKNNGDKAPWSWGLPSCQYDSDGAGLGPSDQEKPQVCTGNGAIPASRECLNSCNFMLTTVNSGNPCNGNVVNAANACARCKGANMFVQTGKEATGTYMDGELIAQKLIDGLRDWCAKPSRCYDLKGGKRISGIGGCPVLAANDPIKQGPSITTTSTRSFTDINGRPTFALELLTIEDANFTANSEFAGSRPTDTVGTGGGSPIVQVISLSSCFFGLLAAVLMCV